MLYMQCNEHQTIMLRRLSSFQPGTRLWQVIMVYCSACHLRGDVLYTVPEGAFEVADTSGAEFFAYVFYFYQYFVVHFLLFIC